MLPAPLSYPLAALVAVRCFDFDIAAEPIHGQLHPVILVTDDADARPFDSIY